MRPPDSLATLTCILGIMAFFIYYAPDLMAGCYLAYQLVRASW